MTLKYENLDVWQKSIKLTKLIYIITDLFPKSEIYGLVSQVRRAIVSVSLNIAEGSMRGSKKEFIQFLRIAIGSLVEVRTCVLIAVELGYFQRDQQIDNLIDEIYFKLLRLEKSMKPDYKSNNSNILNNSNNLSPSNISNNSNNSNRVLS